MSEAEPATPRIIERFDPKDGSITAYGDAFRAAGVRVCTFEESDVPTPAPIKSSGGTVGQLLDEIVALLPGYRWEEPAEAFYNLLPAQSVLDTALPAIRASSEGAWAILTREIGIGRLGVSLFQELGDPAGPPIDLDLPETDLRGALNAIALAIGGVVWHIAGRDGAYRLTFTGV